jgi:hypothetical protein
MILGIQILGLLFGLLMIYYSFVNFKKKELKRREFVMWLIVWILFIIITLIPTLLDPIIVSLDLARRMDFYIIIGFMFLIGLGFYSYSIAKKNQKKIEEIVRMSAFKKEEEK